MKMTYIAPSTTTCELSCETIMIVVSGTGEEGEYVDVKGEASFADADNASSLNNVWDKQW